MTEVKETKLAAAQFLLESYKARSQAAIAKERLKRHERPPLDKAGIRRDAARIRHEAMSNMATDEQYMGIGVLWAAWEQYKSGDWRFHEDEPDSFLDYMQNSVRVYSRGYREDMYRIIERIFAWVNKPNVKVLHPTTGKQIDIEMIFEACNIKRLKSLSPLFETDDEDAKAKHLRYLITNVKETEDDQTDADDEYKVSNDDGSFALPVMEIEHIGDNVCHVHMFEVSIEQLNYLRLALAGIRERNFTGVPSPDEEDEADEQEVVETTETVELAY